MAKLKYNEELVNSAISKLEQSKTKLSSTVGEMSSAVSKILSARGGEYLDCSYLNTGDAVVQNCYDLIDQTITDINDRVDMVKAYNEEYDDIGLGTKILATAGHIGVSVGEGVLSAGEQIFDGFASGVGFLFGLAHLDGAKDTIGKIVEKDYVGDAFDKLYDNQLSGMIKASAMQKDGVGHAIFKGVGTAAGYTLAMAGTGAIGGALKTVSSGGSVVSNMVATSKALTGSLKAGMFFAGVGGVGTGTQAGLQSGMDYNQAFLKGAVTGAGSAALVFGINKLVMPAVSKAWSKTGAKVIDKIKGLKNANTTAVTTELANSADDVLGKAAGAMDDVTNGASQTASKAADTMDDIPKGASGAEGSAKAGADTSTGGASKAENVFKQGANSTDDALNAASKVGIDDEIDDIVRACDEGKITREEFNDIVTKKYNKFQQENANLKNENLSLYRQKLRELHPDNVAGRLKSVQANGEANAAGDAARAAAREANANGAQKAADTFVKDAANASDDIIDKAAGAMDDVKASGESAFKPAEDLPAENAFKPAEDLPANTGAKGSESAFKPAEDLPAESAFKPAEDLPANAPKGNGEISRLGTDNVPNSSSDFQAPAVRNNEAASNISQIADDVPANAAGSKAGEVLKASGDSADDLAKASPEHQQALKDYQAAVDKDAQLQQRLAELGEKPGNAPKAEYDAVNAEMRANQDNMAKLGQKIADTAPKADFQPPAVSEGSQLPAAQTGASTPASSTDFQPPAVVDQAQITGPTIGEQAQITGPVIGEQAQITGPVIGETPQITGPVIGEGQPAITGPVVGETPAITGPVAEFQPPAVADAVPQAPVVAETTPVTPSAPVAAGTKPVVVLPLQPEGTPPVEIPKLDPANYVEATPTPTPQTPVAPSPTPTPSGSGTPSGGGYTPSPTPSNPSTPVSTPSTPSPSTPTTTTPTPSTPVDTTPVTPTPTPSVTPTPTPSTTTPSTPTPDLTTPAPMTEYADIPNTGLNGSSHNDFIIPASIGALTGLVGTAAALHNRKDKDKEKKDEEIL